ncbi:MAG: NAD-dependent dehydratase [Candidatus Marinimicrobia bacterium]|nr:NAD-dependent dehydratase [Candidatus Neomarinimicrobiota bacterium]|tara:strand:+ start:1289 stop:2254 length:966 start_codon:yes stop_codon:yes gene_type:complete
MDISGKKFLVTGGAGFIGSHLVDMLLQEEVEKVLVFDNFIRGGINNLNKSLKDERLELFKVKGDLTSLDEINNATKNIDGVFHLACLSLPYCQEYPRSALNVNIVGTFNLIEACVKNNVDRIVFTSSSSVYGNAQHIPMDENHPYKFRDFYGATKLTCESLLRAFYFKHNLEYLSLRFMNIYGPRQDYLGAYIAIIIKIIDRLQKGLNPIIYGDGTQAFDFVFVEDACRSLILAMTSPLKNSVINISSGKQVSIIDLCKKIQEIMQNNNPIQFINNEENKHLVTNRIGSTKKAKKELGFEVQTPLENGLRKVIEWKLNQGN